MATGSAIEWADAAKTGLGCVLGVLRFTMVANGPSHLGLYPLQDEAGGRRCTARTIREPLRLALGLGQAAADQGQD
jgi:hypothetical protein